MSHHKSILDGYTLNWIRRHKSAKTIIKIPMSKSRRKFLRQIFDGFDEDGGGDIDFGEFRKAVQFADPRATYEQALQLFKSIDLDDGGTIDFEEFCHGMERKEAEDANNKKKVAESKKDHSKEDDNLHHIALDHQRSSQLDAINSEKIKDTLKLKSFRALFKTHALTFPSSHEEDEKIARAENKAHLSHVRMRRELGTKGTDRFGRKNKERMRQCIIGVAVDIDEHLEPYGLHQDDFDDIVAKPLTLQNFKASLAKIDSLHPHEAKLAHGGNLQILVADSSSTAASLHGRMLAAVGHHVTYQDGIVEDQVISGNFDVLLTSTDCSNKISKKPIVRHIRDHEKEQIRKLTEAQESLMSKEKKKELQATNMINKHNISFTNTYVAEDKSSVYASNIRLKSFAAARSVNEERKLVDNEILASVGLRKSRSYDSLSSSYDPSSLLKAEDRNLTLSSASTYNVGPPSAELQKALAEINGTTNSIEPRPDTAQSSTPSVVSRPGTSQSRPGTSQSMPGKSLTRPGSSQSMEKRPVSSSPVQFVPDVSIHASSSFPDVIHSVPSSSHCSSSPNIHTSKISPLLSPSTTLLRPINVIKKRNNLNSHSRTATSPILDERTRLLTNGTTSAPSFETRPIIKLPSSITRKSNNNVSHGMGRRAKSGDNLEKMASTYQ